MDRLRRRASRLGLDISTERLSIHRRPNTASSDRDIVSPLDKSTPKGNSTVCFLWPASPTTPHLPASPGAPRLKHIPIDIAQYYESANHLNCDDTLHTALGSSPPRLRRHIPIIIPRFAEPFAPNSACSSPQSQSGDTSSSIHPSAPGISHAANDGLKVSASFHPTRHVRRVSGQAKMNSSQSSLQSLEQSQDPQHTPSQQPVNTGTSVGISPLVSQQSTGPTNLSGLVCNVHRTSGEEPHALVGATTTILGDKLYVFGGRIHSRTEPRLTSDLFELDLIRRKWTKLETAGDIPAPRYFHSVCGLGDNKLVCYGGMSPAPHLRQQNDATSTPPQAGSDPQPEVVVMSDVHILDVPTRTWSLIATTENPQGRYAHCATILPSSGVFTSATAPLSAIHHNPSSSDPHSGTLGVQLDGTAGAEMVIVGGQDNANNYIEQISVFNLRSLTWTATSSWDRKCGAYKSMVAPLTGIPVASVGRGPVPPDEEHVDEKRLDEGSSMLIYSNYNFLDVKLELQIRLPDGSLTERPISGSVSPPGLRFPNGGIVDNHFVVSGTYLTSSKHEYALWALDLRTLTWGRIDTNGTVFSQGSWNRGILWGRRNTFVILGHRKRNLVDDYNHRRINFAHICLVELEAFGLYDNPRRCAPTSGYTSMSSPAIPVSLQLGSTSTTAGGRPYTSAAARLGEMAMTLTELADMELVAKDGERLPCNSHILSRRWGPFFNQLLAETVATRDNSSMSDAATLRPNMHSQATSRNSSITITPSIGGASNMSGATTLSVGPSDSGPDQGRSASRATTRTVLESRSDSVSASRRPRALFLPHTAQTIQLMLHYLYTSSLPPVGGPLCTPHILCSLLQMARPYQIDGLLEATVERLHEVLDGRNAAAVFNAAAMAAGGGRGLRNSNGGTLETLQRQESNAASDEQENQRIISRKTANLRVDTTMNGVSRGHERDNSLDSASTASSTSTANSLTDTESNQDSEDRSSKKTKEEKDRDLWTGDVSSVIGLQKRGLRGLMEGRRLRERAQTIGQVPPD